MPTQRRTALLSTTLLALTLPFLVGATTPPPASRPGARAVAQREAAARRALTAVTDRYRAMRGYQLEGRGGTSVTSSQGDNESVTWVRFAVLRPDRYAGEIRSTDMTTRLVMDGDSLWTAIPVLGQYQVQAVASVRPAMDSTAWTRQFDPAYEYAHLLEDLVSVTALGRDTVHTNAGVVNCDRFAVTTKAAAQAGEGIRVHPRVLWVDPATQMVLLDSVRIDQQHPQLGEVTSVNVTRMVVARPDPTFAADAFRFRPDPDLRRVRRFARTSAEHAALEGRKASDFTLETLDGAKAVKLSELKGHVVLLDFWATWCGPCRGWLPIVAKAHREYEAKGLRVFAVNEREPEAKVRTYLTKQNLNVPVLMDRSGTVGMMYRASSIPLTVVIGRDGNVLRVLVGLHGEEDLKDVLAEAGLVL
jgi:thiol-disulfide isomerase/thioredoxin